MATIIPPGNPGSQVISNLDTYTYTVPVGGANQFLAQIAINELPPSGITLTIKQNTTTVASTSAPAAQQQAINLAATMNCADGDVISVIVASSTPSDEGPQSFKGILNIRVGGLN